MLGRTLSDLMQALIFLCTVESDIDQCTEEATCHVLGGAFTIGLVVSALYYTIICGDLYLTLKNPFRKPVSNSMWIHFAVIMPGLILGIIIGAFKAFEYRQDFQFCWTKYDPGFNLWNLFVVYVPLSAVVIGGIGVTWWSMRRLNSKMLDNTFELRWKIIKRQLGIVGCFTINYVIQGAIWILAFHKHEDEPTMKPPQPYSISIFVICAVFFDLVAWCAKDSIFVCWKKNYISSTADAVFDDGETAITSMNAYGDDSDDEKIIEVNPELPDNNDNELNELRGRNDSPFNKFHNYNPPKKAAQARPVTARTQLLNQKYDTESQKSKEKKKKRKQEQQNLSNALRREVITFITAGLVTGVKVTAWETNKNNNDQRNTFDNDFDDYDDDDGYGGNYREDTETHPALQMFPHFQQQQPKPPGMNHSRSASTANNGGYKKNFTGYHPKANSYAGFLMEKVIHGREK